MSSKPFTGLRKEVVESVTPGSECLVGYMTGIRLSDGTEFAVVAKKPETLCRVFGRVAELGDVYQPGRDMIGVILKATDVRLDEEI